jgi:hypothetical protein
MLTFIETHGLDALLTILGSTLFITFIILATIHDSKNGRI